MITSSSHFKPQRERINNLLLTDGEQPRTTYFFHKGPGYPYTKEELKAWYINNFSTFPLHTSEKVDTFSISNRFQEAYRKYHELDPVKETQTVLRKELEGLDRDSLLLDLEEYVIEWIDNMYLDFGQMMEFTKKDPTFACITDDLIIMKNLLKFYMEVRKTEDIQLYFFDNTFIPKAVADQMTDILIILLTDRILMMEPGFNPSATSSISSAHNSNFKINWLASQQEFGEFIHELTNKRYISFPDTALSMQASYLTRFFDFSTSQRKAGSNIANNILKVLQPVFDHDEKKDTYSYLKPGYTRKFDMIPAYISKKEKNK
jgi:hypothetical protein